MRHTVTLQALLDRTNGGDNEAKNELLKFTSERILRLTRMMFHTYPGLQRWEQTDDIFQQAMLRIGRELELVQPTTSKQFLGFAALQIRRSLIDMVRHHFGPHGDARHLVAGDHEGRIVRGAEPRGHHSEPESLLEWVQFHESVEKMPPDEREVFSMKWYSGMQHEEIASTLDISLATVKRRWHRARIYLFDVCEGIAPPVEE
ncbi:MAG: sigma-70 family RNA polymerase sigma factor [Planctomycetales bacterium]|nr:sigma-70 family RNA polymerase sigma factor [Planctomycetales bacterium]